MKKYMQNERTTSAVQIILESEKNLTSDALNAVKKVLIDDSITTDEALKVVKQILADKNNCIDELSRDEDDLTDEAILTSKKVIYDVLVQIYNRLNNLIITSKSYTMSAEDTKRLDEIKLQANDIAKIFICFKSNTELNIKLIPNKDFSSYMVDHKENAIDDPEISSTDRCNFIILPNGDCIISVLGY